MYKYNVREIISGLNKKEFSVYELINDYYHINEKFAHFNAYVAKTIDMALIEAKKADTKIATGTQRPLEGVPIAIKDLFCTNGVKTTACSKILKDFVPRYTSTVCEKLFSMGAIMLGKTNCDEFAMGSSNQTSYFGSVINPWSEIIGRNIVPGGSSGGSAAAVAGCLAPCALGTDTGGSIRQPAAFTGTVGIKPTYGRCSRYGMIAFSSSLDQAGVFARNVGDAALILQHIMGHDPLDPTTVNMDYPELLSALDMPIKGMRIGIPMDLMSLNGTSEDVKNMWLNTARILESEGATLVDVNLRNAKYALPVYYIIAPAEASSNLARYDGVRYGHRSESYTDLDDMYKQSRTEGFGDEVKRRIITGTYVLSAGFRDAYYIKAQKIRRMIMEEFVQCFENVDAIIMPSAPTEAFDIGSNQSDPTIMYLNDVFTIPVSLAGLPSMSIPAGISRGGLPLGMQVICNHYDEYRTIQVSSAIERNTDFVLKPLIEYISSKK